MTGAVVDTDIPAPIRQRAQQAVDRRQLSQAARPETGPGATAHCSAVLLSRLAAAFPRTFFPEPKQVQPLTAFLYRDLLKALSAGVLPAGIDRPQLKAFLRWYGGRTSYLTALARGAGRIDLTGAVVATDIPTALRQRAREDVQRRRQQQAARSGASAATAPPAAPRAAAPAARPPRSNAPPPAPTPAFLLNLEELYAVATDAKLEVTLKFSTLPEAKPAGGGKMAFALRTPDGAFVVAEISNKVWAKLVQANADWPSWMAALTGTMGERTEKGFRLANPGLQVFERKPKAAADAPAPTATAPTPAEPVAPPPPAAPVTVTTCAGTATVTKRNPLSLKRNPSTEKTPG